jgi:hypothetical protein
MDVIHRPVFYLKHKVSETGFYICLQANPVHLRPIDRATPYFGRRVIVLFARPN